MSLTMPKANGSWKKGRLRRDSSSRSKVAVPGPSDEHWQHMLKREQKYTRNWQLLSRHPQITAEMRSILLDWMMQVCQELGFLRLTFHLSSDILDRYLAHTVNFRRDKLQLAGVAAIVIAAKKEESNAPRLDEVGRYTAGSCTVTAIRDQELHMLEVLRWNLCPVLAPDWLSLYLQSLFSNPSMISTPSASAAFNLPGNVGSEVNERKFPRETFVNIMQLIDVCLLDVESLRFPIGLLTAAALYHFSCQKVALIVSGYSRDQLNVCVRWMTRFAEALAQEGLKPMKRLPGKYENDSHNYQPWEKALDSLKRAHELRYKYRSTNKICQQNRRTTSVNDSMEIDSPSPPGTPDTLDKPLGEFRH